MRVDQHARTGVLQEKLQFAAREDTEGAGLDGTVIVVGSANYDHTSFVSEFADPGATIFATDAHDGLGGKGANQAVAAAILGRDVRFIGQVGDDATGRAIAAGLAAAGVNTESLMVTTSAGTGTAHITVNQHGENVIIVYSGANATVDPVAVSEHLEGMRNSGLQNAVILSQGELTSPVLRATATTCQQLGLRFVLNLAPCIELDAFTLAQANPLIVNEGEARDIVKRVNPNATFPQDPAALAEFIADQVAPSVVITLGARGAIVTDGTDIWAQPAVLQNRVLDTTGAGDAFTGVVASVLAAGGSLRQAVEFGTIAGGLAVTRHGAADSYPSSSEVLQEYTGSAHREHEAVVQDD